jgi:hypothetical protein
LADVLTVYYPGFFTVLLQQLSNTGKKTIIQVFFHLARIALSDSFAIGFRAQLMRLAGASVWVAWFEARFRLSISVGKWVCNEKFSSGPLAAFTSRYHAVPLCTRWCLFGGAEG